MQSNAVQSWCNAAMLGYLTPTAEDAGPKMPQPRYWTLCGFGGLIQCKRVYIGCFFLCFGLDFWTINDYYSSLFHSFHSFTLQFRKLLYCIYTYPFKMQFTTAFIASLLSGAALARSIPTLVARGYPGLDDVQSRNADAAIGEVRAEGLGRQACLAVISTALQESTLHIYANPAVPESLNYPHDLEGGDQDSIGMFQQRPEFYPDIAADMDAAGSTRQFLAVMKGIQGWETMEISALDQAVQRAEAGNLYAQRIPLATQVCDAAGF